MFHICQNFKRGFRDVLEEVVELTGPAAMAIV
jgi:hypothetical protein